MYICQYVCICICIYVYIYMFKHMYVCVHINYKQMEDRQAERK